MRTYIHYGNTHFEADRFKEIKNAIWVKPHGGFWASPIDAAYGWKDWCGESEFRDCLEENSFKFTLRDDAKVLVINTYEELLKLPRQHMQESFSCPGSVYLDFEQIIANGYDAIEVNLSNDNRLYWALYGWDCDSLLVLNKDIVKEQSNAN